MKFMYKYVDLNSDIILEYIILCLYHIYNFKHMLWIFTSEGQFVLFLLWKPNCFQYSFVTINYFYFITINATLVQIFFSDKKC